jgi:hypothetical protein
MRFTIITLLLLVVHRASAQSEANWNYWPEGRFRSCLEEYRKAKLPEDSYKFLFVIGAVERPGKIPVEGCSLLTAIERAGGLFGWR